MARKEINIFGTSFLDLLSGALAAVIILFVIVPKMTREEVEILQKVKDIEVIAADVEVLLEKIKNSVPKEVLASLEEEMDRLRAHIEELQRKLTELEEEARQITRERDELRKTVKEQQEEMERLKARLAELEAKAEEAKEKERTANTVEKTLGVFARFGILCKWEETGTDVDMGVQRFGMQPEQCWRMYPSKKWGILGQDVRERTVGEEERFELFYVPEIYDDVYTFWVNVYEHSGGGSANVTCIMIFHPGEPDEQRREIGPVYITKGGNKCVATFRLNELGFELLPHREPLWGNGKVIK